MNRAIRAIAIVVLLTVIPTQSFAVQTVQLLPKPIEKVVYDNDVSSNKKEYYGWAPVNSATSSAVWKIMRVTYATADATDDFTIEYADGNSLYDNVWDDRASLTYQ